MSFETGALCEKLTEKLLSEGILLLDGRGGRDRAAPSAAQQAVHSASSVSEKLFVSLSLD